MLNVVVVVFGLSISFFSPNSLRYHFNPSQSYPQNFEGGTLRNISRKNIYVLRSVKVSLGKLNLILLKENIFFYRLELWKLTLTFSCGLGRLLTLRLIMVNFYYI